MVDNSYVDVFRVKSDAVLVRSYRCAIFFSPDDGTLGVHVWFEDFLTGRSGVGLHRTLAISEATALDVLVLRSLVTHWTWVELPL